jgi:thioredoxin 1
MSMKEILNNDKIVFEDIYPKIIYFTAKWCGPCQRIGPLYSYFAQNNPGIKFFKVDVDKNDEITTAFKVKSMPTFFFFRSKTNYLSFTGADENKLKVHMDYITKI